MAIAKAMKKRKRKNRWLKKLGIVYTPAKKRKRPRRHSKKQRNTYRGQGGNHKR
jgi:hypothetical protein